MRARGEVECLTGADAAPHGRSAEREALLDDRALRDGERAARDVVVVKAHPTAATRSAPAPSRRATFVQTIASRAASPSTDGDWASTTGRSEPYTS